MPVFNRNCFRCKIAFQTRDTTTYYCSHACIFLSKFTPTNNESCWIWNGKIDKCGYGGFCGHKAHRFSYQYYKGLIGTGLIIRHTCNIRNCVNPYHLESGTHKDNYNDRLLAGPIPSLKGSSHPQSKLKEDEVKEILLSLQSSSILAKKYNVSKTSILSIKQGRTWNNISELPNYLDRNGTGSKPTSAFR